MTPDIPSANRPPGPGEPLDSGKRGVGTGVGPGTALALLGAVLVTAPASLLTVYVTPQSMRPEVAWGSGAAACALWAAVTVAAYQLLTARRLRVALAEQRATAVAVHTDAMRFAEVTVPAVVDKLRDGASADAALASVVTGEDAAQRRVLSTLATEVHRSEGMRAAAMSACANAAGRVQALTTSMAADLREMEHRHSDEDVLGDLLHLDHRTAQAGRLADCIAVLTGARSGRRWAKPIVMESILRGAMGRISGYQRIRLHSTSTVAITGHAAEGVMHALAELMDNAANFSPPTADVHVYVEEVSAGVVIMIEDGGLVMSEVALRRAEEAVSPVAWELTARSGTRLGLPVVGRLARKHGLSVSFRPSAHGGTGVLLMIPQELITQAGGRGPAAARTGAAGAGKQPDAQPDTQPARTPAALADAGASADTDDAGTDDAGTDASAEPAAPVPPAPPAPTDAAGTPDEPLRDAATLRVRISDPSRDTDTRHVRDQPVRDTTHVQSTPYSPPPPPPPPDALDDPPTVDALEVPVGSHTADEPPPEHGNAAEHSIVQYGESGLPKRPRGRTLAAAQRPSGPDPAGTPAREAQEPRAARTPQQSGSRFGAFRQAVREGAQPEDGGTGSGPPHTSPTSPAHSSPRPEDDAE